MFQNNLQYNVHLEQQVVAVGHLHDKWISGIVGTWDGIVSLFL